MTLNFSIAQKEICSALSLLQSICSKKTSLESTINILFEIDKNELILKATDLDVSLQCSLLLNSSSTSEPQGFLVHGKRIFEIINNLDGDLNFKYDGKRLAISSQHHKKLNLTLATAAPEHFPPFPDNIENLTSISSSFLTDSLNKLMALCPSNNANPAINGILCEVGPEQLSLVTTDGHSLARIVHAAYKLSEPKSWTLPKKSAAELKKVLDSSLSSADIFLGVSRNLLVFSGQNFNFFTRVIANKFPAYEALLSTKDFFSGTVDTSSLLPALRRVSCLLGGKFIATNFTFAADGGSLVFANSEIGELTEGFNLANYHGPEVAACFYSPYLLTALQAFEGNSPSFLIKNHKAAIFFEQKNGPESFTYLVMPVVQNL